MRRSAMLVYLVPHKDAVHNSAGVPGLELYRGARIQEDRKRPTVDEFERETEARRCPTLVVEKAVGIGPLRARALDRLGRALDDPVDRGRAVSVDMLRDADDGVGAHVQGLARASY